MSILQPNLKDNPCAGRIDEGADYLEFACVYGIEKYYAE